MKKCICSDGVCNKLSGSSRKTWLQDGVRGPVRGICHSAWLMSLFIGKYTASATHRKLHFTAGTKIIQLVGVCYQNEKINIQSLSAGAALCGAKCKGLACLLFRVLITAWSNEINIMRCSHGLLLKWMCGRRLNRWIFRTKHKCRYDVYLCDTPTLLLPSATLHLLIMRRMWAEGFLLTPHTLTMLRPPLCVWTLVCPRSLAPLFSFFIMKME